MKSREEELLEIELIFDILSDLYSNGNYGYEYSLSELSPGGHKQVIDFFGFDKKEVVLSLITSFKEELENLSKFWFRNHFKEEISEKEKEKTLERFRKFGIYNFNQLSFDEIIIGKLIDFVGEKGKVLKLISTIGKDEKNLREETNLVFSQQYLIEFKDSSYILYFEMTT